jgi:hypothetical protein
MSNRVWAGMVFSRFEFGRGVHQVMHVEDRGLRSLCVWRPSLATLCALAGLLLWVSPALAAHVRPFVGSFSSGSLTGVGVDQETGNVFVADSGAGVVDVFGAEGGSPTVGVPSQITGFEFGGEPAGLGVDNSCYYHVPRLSGSECELVDPSNGDVYVANTEANAVDKLKLNVLSEKYEVVESFGGFKEVNGVAVDHQGNVYVADFFATETPITEFNSEGGQVGKIEQQTISHPAFVAVGAPGVVYVGNYEGGVAKIVVNASDEVQSEAMLDSSGRAVAVDQQGDALIDNESSVSEYDSSGKLVGVFGASGPGAIAESLGIAVSDASAQAYVSNRGGGGVDIFGPTALIPEVLTGEGANLATEGSATLNGTVNPEGLPVASCEFEYGTTTEYGLSAPCSQSSAEIGSGTSAVPVSATVSGLEPRTVYHFRLVASNANGTNRGLDRTFTTTAHATIDGESVADVTSSSATLSAEINPGALATTYRFEYGTTTAYEKSLPMSGGDAGSGIEDVRVQVHPQDLQPNTPYHFRVVASNALGPVDGADHEFTTQPTGGGSSGLPDGRAYELVSPPNKNGGAVSTDKTDQVSSWESSPDGNEVAYSAPQPFADAHTGAASGEYYLATRAASGWSSQALLPPQAPGCNACQPQVQIYTRDLSKAILLDGGGEGFGQDEPQLVAGEPQKNPNLFIRDNSTGAYELVDVTPTSAIPAQANLQGASSELSHVVFSENAQLTANAPSGEDLYEWAAGAVRLISVLPGGSPAAEALLGDGANRMRAVSNDGGRIFFTAGGNLYLREDGARSVQLDAPQGPGPGGGGQFMTASSDGSKVFFTDGASAGLTGNTAAASGTNLYEFDVSSGALTDVTPAIKAEVQGVLGTSEDGTYLYFVADGALEGGATSEEPNLYVYHAGTTKFIATLDPNDNLDWEASHQFDRTARITPDGRHLAFESIRSLTGYDNTFAAGASCGEGLGEHCPEVFEYSAEPSELLCVSCNPSGVRPLGPSTIGHHAETNFQAENYLSRNLSDDGTRLFFDSSDALLPAATNGKQNVYEHEQDGAGSCHQAGGCLYLISTGNSSEDSLFEDASATGNDVFFTTDQQLLPQDVDTARDLYDARVGGGIPEPSLTPPCTGESCRPPASPVPPATVAASISFVGPGNANPTGTSSPGKVVLERKTIRGSTVTIRIKVPGAGRIAASGAGLQSVTRRVSEAGTYSLTIHLTTNEKKRVKRKHKVKLEIRVGYRSTAGATSTITVRLTART